MNDLPTSELLAEIIGEALSQAEELLKLDGPRAEAWASDLAALALETGPDAISELIAALQAREGAPAAAALWSIDSIVGGVDISSPALEPAPPWSSALGTSQCEGALLLRARRGESAAFRFVDSADDRHVLVVDLLPPEVGEATEQIGEVTVGPGDLLSVLGEEEAGIESRGHPAAELATRVAAALRATTKPRASAVANGRLLVARLKAMGIEPPAPPVWVIDDVPELAPRDPDDDNYARVVLARALGEPVAPPPGRVKSAAGRLRSAAARDETLAQWLAASVGPIDLDEADLDVVLAALAAPIAPADLAPLDADAREAVLDLEWADWLGVVIGLVREGTGASVEPEALVDQINRCPEVTSTVPKKDRPRVAWALAVCTDQWSSLGLATDGALTELGVALLPAALDRAWGASMTP